MIRLNSSLKKQFRAKVSSYHQSLTTFITDEEDFIDKTVNAFKNFRASRGRQSLRTRSIKIHRKPIVCFPSCSPIFSSKKICREIGDLLFVYKHFSKGFLDAHRASLIQAKYTSETRKTWSIETGQFCLMTRWPKFSLVQPARFSKDYDLRPNAFTWSTYGLVGPNTTSYPIYFSAARILRIHKRQASSTKHFNLTLRSNPLPWDFSAGFFSRFVHALIGENLFSNSPVKTLVDDLYKVVEWTPDPPGEFEWSNQKSEKEGSFGIIEFVITEEWE